MPIASQLRSLPVAESIQHMAVPVDPEPSRVLRDWIGVGTAAFLAGLQWWRAHHDKQKDERNADDGERDNIFRQSSDLHTTEKDIIAGLQEDRKGLRDENRELRGEREALRRDRDAICSERDSLRIEVERLRSVPRHARKP